MSIASGPARCDLLAQRLLARPVVDDRGVLAHRADERRNPAPEARSNVGDRPAGVLDDVVQQPGELDLGRAPGEPQRAGHGASVRYALPRLDRHAVVGAHEDIRRLPQFGGDVVLPFGQRSGR
jgi:hypothetical protein